MARVSQKRGDFDKACQYCEQALEEDGENVRALEELANICDQAGMTEKAQKLRERMAK